MIDFSELLSQHIVQKNIKTYALAQYCGLDRANMYKIINGKRRAPSINIVKKICQFMHLSPVEEKELEESYYVSLVGHTNYYRRKNVLHFFSEFTLSNRLLSSVSCQFEFSLPTLKNATLNGKDEIHRALLHITALELTRKKGHIRLLIQPDFEFLMNILAAQGHSTAATKIDHIICLNNNTEVPHSYKNYNLNCLKRILPLYGCDYQYNSYYYYDNILSKIGTFTLMPYMIITSQYVCLLTSDMQRGALFSEPEFISMFEKIFDEYLIVSSPLLRRLDSAFTQLDYVCDSSPAIKEKYSFQMTPCLTFFLTPGFIEKYIKQDFPERPLFIQKLLKYIENFTHSQFLHSTSFIFSLKGIQHFLSTGRINEYPYEVYDAFDMKDRIYLVKQLLHACKTLDFKMLKNNIGDIRNELFLYVTQQNGYLMFSVPPHQNLVYLDIKEPGLLFTFFDFCKNLEPDLFYTPEETIELITMEIESAKLSQIP